MGVSFSGRVRVQSDGGEFALVGINGRIGLMLPSWKVLWSLARSRSGRTALALVAVFPGIQKVPLPVFIRGRQLLTAQVDSGKEEGKTNPTIRFRLTPLAFLTGKMGG